MMTKRNRKSNSAFTLLELMIAAGILVFAIAGLMSTFIYGSLLGVANRSLFIAATDAQYVLEKLKDQPYADLASYNDTNFTNLVDESVRVTVTTLTNEKNVVVNVTWSDNERLKSYALTTKISF